MRVLILGATGGVGNEIVRQAVRRGHEVTALVRSATRLKSYDHAIRKLEGDLLNENTLENALRNQEAVLSGFGPRLPIAKTERDLLTRFAVALVPAMQRVDVARLVIVSTAFLFKDPVLPPTYLVGRLFFPTVVTDAAAMEGTIVAGSLDWTIVRPPQLTDKPHTGRYRVREGHLPRFGFNISRADLADYMITALEKHSAPCKIVGLCK
jgi:putative NADH-flavin reductase